jgi:hypothetical protein
MLVRPHSGNETCHDALESCHQPHLHSMTGLARASLTGRPFRIRRSLLAVVGENLTDISNNSRQILITSLITSHPPKLSTTHHGNEADRQGRPKRGLPSLHGKSKQILWRM